jgi:D-alanyl-D-alanine carboxypeptidase/D-alanyl-D-alanine-endopeptidase (penicillin-binding protein 4)
VPDSAARVARVMVVPEIAGLKYPRLVPAVEGGCGDWRSRLRADISDPMNIRIGGAYPAGLRRTRHLPGRARAH